MSEHGITGIGGIFFKTKDPSATKEWYQKNLGLTSDKYGHQFVWRTDDNPDERGTTQWSPMPDDTDYYEPSQAPFMINYRVKNLKALIKDLKANGIEIVGEVEEYEYGSFAWILDPDGRKIELWEPIDEAFLK